ncbi:MAG: ABC transporter ATP-binding protein [Gemmatimonadales bacterium]|nr:MAG: ABC transporter ATP-binding protein [Gemmatimonadales bacterium]
MRCRGLIKSFGAVQAVRGLDLEIPRGECYGLLGPNGAGKTTTVEILEGLQEPDRGEVEILGMRWADQGKAIRRRLGVQLQEVRLTDKLRVREVVRLFRSFYPRGPSVAELLERVHLTEKQSAYVRDLSGGQRQRLSVACALAGDPDLLFLDEPTTGLDPQARRALWEIIESFRDEGGTILLTTHFMDEAERLADRVAIMDHGTILIEGTPQQLIATLGGAHVIEFEPTVRVEVLELGELPSVKSVRERGPLRFLTCDELHETLPALVALVDSRGGHLASLTTHRATLDDVFLARTGRQLRDG